MYNSRMSRDELGKQLRILTQRKEIFEKHPIIRAWKKFTTLTYPEQQQIRKEWEKYYDKVKQGYNAEIFDKQYKAMAIGDFATVKEYAAAARSLRLNMAKDMGMPMSIEPAKYDYGDEVEAYRQVCRELEKIQNYPSVERARTEMFDD